MPAADDKVIHPFPSIEQRATKAMADYKAGVADEIAGKVRAIRAVIEYGKALQEGKRKGEEVRNNVAFGQWVKDNKFDVGKPWDDFRERSSAMKIATLIGSVPITRFDACPYTTPTNIMKWYRKMLAPNTDTQKPKAAKPSKPEKSEAPSTPKADIAYVTIVAWLGEGKKITNQRKWFDERRDIASHASFEKAFDRLNREKAEAKTAKASEDSALAKAEAAFSDKSKVTLADAIRIHKARLDKQFEQTVNAEVRKRIAAADDAVRARLKEADQRILQFERERGKRGVFTKEQFRQLQICCHPDASASKETRAVLLDILVKNKTNLVNPEKE